MNKTVNGKQVTIGFRVDDLLMICEDGSTSEDIISLLRGVKEKRRMIQWISWYEISIRENGTNVDMVRQVVLQHLQQMIYSMIEVDRKQLHSVVAKLLCMAEHTHPDILLAISLLASRVAMTNHDDMGKLNRVLRYLNEQKNMSTHFKRESDMVMRAYIDASFT